MKIPPIFQKVNLSLTSGNKKDGEQSPKEKIKDNPLDQGETLKSNNDTDTFIKKTLDNNPINQQQTEILNNSNQTNQQIEDISSSESGSNDSSSTNSRTRSRTRSGTSRSAILENLKH